MRCFFVFCVATASVFGLSTAARATTLFTVQSNEAASKDTFTYSDTPSFNFDGSNSTPAGPPPATIGNTYGVYLGASTTNSGHNSVTFLQFDLSSLAGITAAQVTSAKVTLHSVPLPGGLFPGSASPSGAFPVNVSAFKITSAWNETAVTASASPTFDPSAVTTTSINGVNSDFDFDITALLKGWLDGSIVNNGIRLSQVAEVLNGSEAAVGALFLSSNNAANMPLLQVTAVPEPSSVVMLASAIAAFAGYARRRSQV